MKKLEIIIRPGKLDDLRELLEVCEYHGIMITNIMGYGNQKGVTDQHMWRGVVPKSGNTIPKLKVECVVTAEESEPIIRKVCRDVGQRIEGDANDKLFFRPLKNRPRSLGANGRLTAIIRHIIGEY